MSQELLNAVERLHIKSEKTTSVIDDVLHEQHARKRKRRTPEELNAKLEEDFLTPPTVFGPEWLNKLQRRWDVPVNYHGLFDLAPTQTRTVIRFVREGLEGKVAGYEEVTVPANNATAKDSTSILRKPSNRADFVRGAAGFFPFAPGGLDGVTAVAALEDQMLQNEQHAENSKGNRLDRVIDFGSKDGLLDIPPGFSRGLDFSKTKRKVDKTTEKNVEETLGHVSSDQEFSGDDDQPHQSEDSISQKDSEDESAVEDEDIDSLLPIEFPALEPRGVLAVSTARRGREWAHMVNVKRDITNFKELVPDMARTWPFELDTFQKEAVYHLENGDSVFVAAHTSAGKTVVAEYAIALASKHMTKAIYTSPIKALSNQKFRDFQHEFEDVGILTGDVQINAEASCLIMTTDI